MKMFGRNIVETVNECVMSSAKLWNKNMEHIKKKKG